MKIFFPLEVFYPSQAGGPANTIYWITKTLVRKGFQPVIVASDKGLPADTKLNSWSESDGGRVIYVKTRFLNFPLFQVLVSLANFYKSDIVHISSVFYPTAFVTGLAARLLRKKLIWSPRGELDPLALAHSRSRKRPILWLMRKLIGQYPVFHATCDEESVYLKSVFGTAARVVIIPNYLEIPEKSDRSPGDYLLYIGRLHPKKAIDNLITALSMSKVFSDSNFILKIVGIGKADYQDELLKLVKKLHLTSKIIFAGQIEGIEKQSVFADAYFTIMPSHTENFGIVVLESLAQETPVIASKGAPWEILETEKIGFWIENSPRAIAAAVDKILQLPESVYAEYRARGRNFVIREFDIKQNIDKWVDVYRQL